MTLYLLFCPLPELGPSTWHGILTVVQETHPETWSGGQARQSSDLGGGCELFTAGVVPGRGPQLAQWPQ